MFSHRFHIQLIVSRVLGENLYERHLFEEKNNNNFFVVFKSGESSWNEFCTNKDDIFKLNLDPTLKQFETVLKLLQHLKLTLLEKITVIKTFALPKLE